MKIKIYTDEDVAGAVVKALRRRGYEALTTPECNRCGSTDENQLRYATSLGASILTHNVHDFPRIHYDFLAKGQNHCEQNIFFH